MVATAAETSASGCSKSPGPSSTNTSPGRPDSNSCSACATDRNGPESWSTSSQDSLDERTTPAGDSSVVGLPAAANLAESTEARELTPPDGARIATTPPEVPTPFTSASTLSASTDAGLRPESTSIDLTPARRSWSEVRIRVSARPSASVTSTPRISPASRPPARRIAREIVRAGATVTPPTARI